MAIIKAVDRPGKSLSQIIRYVTRPDKTEHALISGWNLLDARQARAEMTATKKQWGKEGGRQYKHFIQSFRPEDKISPAEAHQIAMELAESSSMFADYEVLIATHQDRDHIHSHFICNSVNIRDGRKFRYAKSELEELKLLSDQIVKQHGYRLEQERDETGHITTWRQALYRVLEAHQAKTKPSWMYDAVLAVLDAADQSLDRETFIRTMESAGYGIRWGSRSVTITTPDGHHVRASRLESVFKIPSLLAQYGDLEEQQELLRSDLQETARNAEPAASGEPEWQRFDLDLRPVPDGVMTRQDGQRYAVACAVCRQLRAAGSLIEFVQGMALGGYQVHCSARAKNTVFVTPQGLHVRSSLIEKRYGLPSIQEALHQLDSRNHETEIKEAYDGELWPQLWMADMERPSVSPVWSGQNALLARQGVSSGSRGIRINGSRSENSSIWQHELDAAAIALGQSLQQKGSPQDWLADNGYSMESAGEELFLVTPRQRRLQIRQEGSIWQGHRPFECIVHFVGRLIWMAESVLGSGGGDGIETVLTLALMTAALAVETAAMLIRAGIDIIITAGDLAYEVYTDREKVVLQPEDREEREAKLQAARQLPEVRRQPEIPPHDLRPLLAAVQQASAAETKQEFVQAMVSQGYGVRWTEHGTLTYILPDGERVRSRRLEEKYGLPSIAAAYGQVYVPQKGPRPLAARAILRALEAPDLSEFNAAMEDFGYTVDWQPELSDAVITAPTGERMRLRSLERTFELPSVCGKYIRYRKMDMERDWQQEYMPASGRRLVEQDRTAELERQTDGWER